MSYRLLLSVSFVYLLCSCSGSATKDKINKAGDAAGQALGQFGKGVSNGVTKAFDMHIDLPKNLEGKGIRFGKISVSSDSAGTDNLLSVYLIFDQDFKQTLCAKAFDNKGQEMGRVSEEVSGKKNEARYVDFHFDKRTNIDSDSKLTLE